jgi:hypothetical protein
MTAPDSANTIIAAIDSFGKTTEQLFVRFELIGSRLRGERCSDIDLLIILSEKGKPSEALRMLAEWVRNLRRSTDVVVMSDDYFLPILLSSGVSDTILHFILFASSTHFTESLFSKAIRQRDSVLRSQTVNSVHEGREATEMLAFENALKFWAMSDLNDLNPKTTKIFRDLRAHTIRKWLSPPECLVSAYYQDLLEFLRKSNARDGRKHG